MGGLCLCILRHTIDEALDRGRYRKHSRQQERERHIKSMGNTEAIPSLQIQNLGKYSNLFG
jgi:hypothetical protein